MAVICMAVKILVKVPGLKRIERALTANERLNKEINDAWGVIYRSYTRQRFDKLSKSGGSGEWPDITEETKQRRRKGKKKVVGRLIAILRDTNMLFAALTTVAGSMLKYFPYTNKIGFVARLESSKKHKKGNATLQEIAEYHHHGEGYLPVRKIIDLPDMLHFNQMKSVAHKIMQRWGKRRL
jgi:hypothetical protein